MTDSSSWIRQPRSLWWHVSGGIDVKLVEIAADCCSWPSVVGIEGVGETESNDEQHQDEGQSRCVLASDAAKSLLDRNAPGCLPCCCG